MKINNNNLGDYYNILKITDECYKKTTNQLDNKIPPKKQDKRNKPKV